MATVKAPLTSSGRSFQTYLAIKFIGGWIGRVWEELSFGTVKCIDDVWEYHTAELVHASFGSVMWISIFNLQIKALSVILGE